MYADWTNGNSGRVPSHKSSESLQQLSEAMSGQASGSDIAQPESSGLHRRSHGSGTEEDIFSAMGGLEIDAEHRSSSYGRGEYILCFSLTHELAGFVHASSHL